MKEIPPLNQPERTEKQGESVWTQRAQEALEERIEKLQEQGFAREERDGNLVIRNKAGEIVLFKDKQSLQKMYEEELKLESLTKENTDKAQSQFIPMHLSQADEHEGLVSRHEIATAIDPLDALLLNNLREDQNKKGH